MKNGVINILKPKGISSFKCVSELRKITGIKKIGHTGTLDPEAEGVLPICIGKATKLIDYIMTNTKEYYVEFKLGITTDTYDLEGKVISERDTSHVTEDMALKAISNYVGKISQVPPMYSALKKDGVRLYELARKGIEIEREAREVEIYELRDIKINLPDISMTVVCSKGTYIRSLCYDIGEDLKTGAVMTKLVRTGNGKFKINDAVPLYDLNDNNVNNFIISMDEALCDFPAIKVEDYFAKLLINGVRVENAKLSKDSIIKNKLYRVYTNDNTFIGIGSLNDIGFKIEKLLIE